MGLLDKTGMRNEMNNDAPQRNRAEPLIDVPLFDVDAPAAEALMPLAYDRLDALIAHGRHHYGELALALGDRLTLAWLRRSGNPYVEEIASISRRLGRPGAVLLNMSYEWSCTSCVAADKGGEGVRMLRTLDWPLPGLGRSVLVARQRGTAGLYYSVTWPGYVGVLTGMAPGRFSAAINQPPLRRRTTVLPMDWIIARGALWRTTGLPPAHLMRRVFDECRDYAEAKRMLIETPLCLPAFFTLAGTAPAEGCIIERRETDAAVHESPNAISNHWIGFAIPGHDRGYDSVGRRASMLRVSGAEGEGFAWLRPPVLNPTTRIAVVANPARGLLQVQGWEKDGPATTVFTLPHIDAVA